MVEGPRRWCHRPSVSAAHCHLPMPAARGGLPDGRHRYGLSRRRGVRPASIKA